MKILDFIRNLNADPDPATQINANLDTDPDTKPWFLVTSVSDPLWFQRGCGSRVLMTKNVKTFTAEKR
jgi:hypothetical protein